jgi:UDP-3-O-[3-hydroxymyristoyl] N-acetylglucosamine deacetylase
VMSGSVSAQQQRTLGAIATTTGIGLHLGLQTNVRLLPAEPGNGRYFVRTDLPGIQPIAATVANVVQTQLSTELGLHPSTGSPSTDADGQSISQPTVRTVEHLLAALTSLAIDNVRIEIDGPEVPLLDGSAQVWVEILSAAGFAVQPAVKNTWDAVAAIASVSSGDAWVTAFPSSELRFSYGIDFELAAIGNQWHSWSQTTPGSSFAADIAPARTFGLAHQIDYLRSQGLIKGGSLENALVCSDQGWLNPPLRFANEPARHKLLDLIGDLSLLGDIPRAHYVAYKASHELHVALAQKLAQNHFLTSS